MRNTVNVLRAQKDGRRGVDRRFCEGLRSRPAAEVLTTDQVRSGS